MALPNSGNPISMSQVNTELGYSSTATISLNDSAVRTLFAKASGAISMSDGYGKANLVRHLDATGGTVTYDGDYQIHTFNSSSTWTSGGGGFRFTQIDSGYNTQPVEFLIVAGGYTGTAGDNPAGGSGGQGAKTRYRTNATHPAGFTVAWFEHYYGAPNNGATIAIAGGSGSSSQIVNPNAYYTTLEDEGGYQRNGSAYTANSGSQVNGGGGGTSPGESGAAGTNGLSCSITGSSVNYGGGGGGGGAAGDGSFSGSPGGSGGAGGGGDGGSGGDQGVNGNSGANASANTGGGGGGGGGSDTTVGNAGNGGSGKVIIRFKYRF